MVGNPPLLLPPPLPRGGTLGIVAPASPVASQEVLERGLEVVRREGFRVVLGDHLWDRYGHLAGRDADRAADLHAMFTRPDVDAILCARGGSGSIRLLNYLDWELITAHPKPFLGYSDVTSLQLAFLRRCGLPSFFAPMVGPDFAREPTERCQELLWRQVCESTPAGVLDDPRVADSETLVGGVAEGPCVGGTLALVAATLGTPYELQTEGAIFCFEDVHESPARVERYLTQLLLAGKLTAAAGFLIGNVPWDATEEERARFLTARQVYLDLLVPLGKPLVYGIPFGHDPSPITLPLGIRLRLETAPPRITVLDAAVAPHR
jgi:muramoyltetrapeptide carboxypeptidase